MTAPTVIHPSWIARPRPPRHRARLGVLAAIASPAVPDADPLADLPPVQRAVARLVAEGWLMSDIATALGVAEHTVKHHASEVYRHLGIDGTTHASSRQLTWLVAGWAGRCLGMEEGERG